MAARYKLTYFNITSLGEPIRFLLSYGGEEFDDVRLDYYLHGYQDNWEQAKSAMPFGKMPVLEIDGKKAHQSLAICRYLGKQFKLAGDNDWEAMEIDIVADTILDLRSTASDYFRSTMTGADAVTVAQKKAVVIDETVPYYLAKFEEQVKANKGYFVNGKLTWVDFYWATMIETFGNILAADLLENYPHLQVVKDRVFALPAVKAWVAKRPVTFI